MKINRFILNHVYGVRFSSFILSGFHFLNLAPFSLYCSLIYLCDQNVGFLLDGANVICCCCTAYRFSAIGRHSNRIFRSIIRQSSESKIYNRLQLSTNLIAIVTSRQKLLWGDYSAQGCHKWRRSAFSLNWVYACLNMKVIVGVLPCHDYQ